MQVVHQLWKAMWTSKGKNNVDFCKKEPYDKQEKAELQNGSKRVRTPVTLLRLFLDWYFGERYNHHHPLSPPAMG